jgi:hypothetical protein
MPVSVTITDPQLLSQLVAVEHEVELVDPAGQSLGVLTRPIVVPGSNPPNLPVLTRARAEAIIAAAKKVGEHPLFEDHLRAIQEWRKIHNTTEPDDE